jgi:protein-S-isoprenylcysteine O-methyltransferase Ste14
MALGAAGLTWCMLEHYPRGETVAVSLVPETLLGAGPYRFSRNPMYVSELTLWFGCSQYGGSPVSLGGGVAFAVLMRYAIGREEQTLVAEFPDEWRDYADRVRRWL